MTAHPKRCKCCKFGDGTGGHWCYYKPESNGGNRQWIDQVTYDNFISILGCASFVRDHAKCTNIDIHRETI